MNKDILRILIIEDNIDHVELLSGAIERHFAPVDLHTVESVDDAADFIDQTDYDLVFTDLYINNESIMEQIPPLRAKLGNTPIIVITGSGDETLAAEAIKKGATDYLVKTRDSLEKIAPTINKYMSTYSRDPEKKRRGRAPTLRERIVHEVSTLNRQAKHMTSTPSAGRIPDIKQLESLLDQIQRLKDLAAKLMEK